MATAAAAAAAACAAITVTCMGVRLDEAAAALALRGASGSFRPVAAAAARGKAKRVGGRSRGLAEAAAPILHNDKRSVEALDGSLLENAETVHRDMSAEILVSEFFCIFSKKYAAVCIQQQQRKYLYGICI